MTIIIGLLLKRRISRSTMAQVLCMLMTQFHV